MDSQVTDPNVITQVKDDIELLDLMLQDSKTFSPLYRPSHYWQSYNKKFIKELKLKGLKNFRRRKNSMLTAFGGTDLNSSSRYLTFLYKGRGNKKKRISNFLLRNFLKSRLGKRILDYIAFGYSGVDQNDLDLLCYNFAKTYGHIHNAKPLSDFSTTLIGNPENVFKIDNNLYTIRMFFYYITFAYCSRFVDFNNIHSIMEIGGGDGKQTELIKKLYPHITFYLLDIPPQLYVAEQYLSSVFPGSVVSYRETRKMDKIPNTLGKIFIMPTSKISAVLGYDLFLNQQSFQEMEPDIVLNYLKHINKQSKYVFLSNTLKGKETAKKIGSHGVLKKTTLSHYMHGLDNFEMVNMESQIRLPGLSKIKYSKFMFLKRKGLSCNPEPNRIFEPVLGKPIKEKKIKTFKGW